MDDILKKRRLKESGKLIWEFIIILEVLRSLNLLALKWLLMYPCQVPYD
jgi:hypothetical protein